MRLSQDACETAYLRYPGKDRLGPEKAPEGRPARVRPSPRASVLLNAPALLAACLAAREGLVKKPVLEFIERHLDV